MKKIPPTYSAFFSLVAIGSNVTFGADLLGYYDFDDVSDPAVAVAVGGIAPDADITVATFSADMGGHSGEAGDYALNVGTANNSGGYARVPEGRHFDLAANTNQMAVSFWQFNIGDGVGGFFATSAFWVDSPIAAIDRRGFQAHTPWVDGTFYFDQSGCCGGANRLTTTGVITANIWQHIVLQRDSAGSMEIWVDGVMAVSSANVEALDSFSGILTIGANGGGGNNFTGFLDEFAIYAGALSQSEIEQLAAGTSNPGDIASEPSDRDNDGLLDTWEELFGLSADDDGSVDINNGPAGDPDMDGLTNLEEQEAGLEPNNDDFDEDGLLDGVESGSGEYIDENDTGTDPKLADSDGDGLSDGVEDPGEDFVDANQPGTDPTKADTDGDGFGDLDEIVAGSDPTDPGSIPDFGALELLVYYDFNGQLSDQTGNAPDATLAGAAALTTGGMGLSGNAGDESLDLMNAGDGSAGQVGVGAHFTKINLSDAASVCFWQYNELVASSSAFWLIAPSAGANQRGMQAHTPWNNGITYLDVAGQTAGTGRLTSTGSTQTGQWQHFVFQKNSIGTLEIWIDGVMVATSEGAPSFVDFDGSFTIGAEGTGLTNSFAGRIDDFAVYSNVLDSEQIALLADGTSPADLFGPQAPLMITEFEYDDDTDRATLTWNSKTNAIYSSEISTDLVNWAEVDDNISSQGATTTVEFFVGRDAPKLFFRVFQNN